MHTSIPYLKTHTTKLAIFASGTGSNASKLIEYFTNHASIQVALIVCNNAEAGVVAVAEKYQIHSLIIEKKPFVEEGYLDILKEYQINWLILAGFLWKIPPVILQAYPFKVINIHPALLPKYGGKGMYGIHVHEAVVNNKETQTGITIHFANEQYDEGKHIFQAHCNVEATDNATTVAKKVQALEHQYFASIVEQTITAHTASN